jgi:ABC-2 type transport system permease protein
MARSDQASRIAVSAARIRAMMRKELIHVLRDPRMKIVLLVMPLLQTVLFGYAVNSDASRIELAACDLDNSSRSRELVRRFTAGDCFDLAARVQTSSQCMDMLSAGSARAAIVIPRGFSRDMSRRGDAEFQFLVDGTEVNTAAAAMTYARSLLRRSVQGTVLRAPGGGLEAQAGDLAIRAWFNPELQSRLFFVPGVIANVVLLATLMLSCMAIVREYERGTIEQILVTPISRVEFMLGKTLPFAAIGLFDALLITAIATLWFGIPFSGNPFALLASIILYLLSALGIGLLVSTISSTQQQALLTSFLFFFPVIMLSGFAYPIANMPVPVQILNLANPLRYMLVIVRSVFLRGAGFAETWHEMAALAAIGSVLLGLAVLRFRKRAS